MPTKFITILAFFLSLLTTKNAMANDVPKDLDLYLLIGQSNMSGRNRVGEIDKTTVPGIYSLNVENKWVLAKEPLHHDEMPHPAVGPGFAFARALKKLSPNRNIGLIPCAVGASHLNVWKPNTKFTWRIHHYMPYDDALKRAKIALNSGKLKGILWLQGEADSIDLKNANAYLGRYELFIERLRHDLKAYDVPFIAAELGHFIEKNNHFKHYKKVNKALHTAAKRSPIVACISSKGATSRGDNLHFDAKSMRLLGERYAVMLTKLNAEKAPVINLWQGTPPLALDKAIIEKINSGKRIAKVETPTLTIYHPKTLKPNCPAVVIYPGGGYAIVSQQYEGDQVAHWLNSIGISAFVLKYRLTPHKHPVPLLDAQEAIRYVRKNAAKYNIDPNKIGVAGFSAGGHLAAAAALQPTVKVKDVSTETSDKPNFAILGYPVISMKKGITHGGSRYYLLGKNPSEKLVNETSSELFVTKNSPPMFIFHGKGDPAVLLKNSLILEDALRKNSIAYELLILKTRWHGFGLKIDWMTDCEKWLKKQNIIK